MDLKQILSTRIKLLREDMKMSQDEFIQRLSISKRTLASYEAAETMPNTQKAIHIAHAFNVEADWLSNVNFCSFVSIRYFEIISSLQPPPFLYASCFTMSETLFGQIYKVSHPPKSCFLHTSSLFSKLTANATPLKSTNNIQIFFIFTPLIFGTSIIKQKIKKNKKLLLFVSNFFYYPNLPLPFLFEIIENIKNY